MRKFITTRVVVELTDGRAFTFDGGETPEAIVATLRAEGVRVDDIQNTKHYIRQATETTEEGS